MIAREGLILMEAGMNTVIFNRKYSLLYIFVLPYVNYILVNKTIRNEVIDV